MYGFHEDFAKEALNFTSRDKLILFRDTIPKQSVARIISVLQMTETAATEAKYLDHGSTVGELDHEADLYCYFYSDQEEGQAPLSFATAKVINRWTTFPFPMQEQWQEASKADPDIAHVIDHISSN